jgi:hypothetical protein
MRKLGLIMIGGALALTHARPAGAWMRGGEQLQVGIGARLPLVGRRERAFWIRNIRHHR